MLTVRATEFEPLVATGDTALVGLDVVNCEERENCGSVQRCQ